MKEYKYEEYERDSKRVVIKYKNYMRPYSDYQRRRKRQTVLNLILFLNYKL